jgi:hypothetical protein
MNSKIATESAFGDAENTDSGNQRKPYEPPVMECLGSLTQLTMGQGALNPDGFKTASS